MAGAVTGCCRAKDWTFFRGEFVPPPYPPPREAGEGREGDIDFARDLQGRLLPPPHAAEGRKANGLV
jgi:hypothetical protein